MNKPPVKPAPVMITVASACEDAKSALECLRDELQEWFDNLPESFQSGSKGEALEEAIGNLDSAIDQIEDAPEESMDVSTFAAPAPIKKRRPSRSDRRDDACALLAAAVDICRLHIGELQEHDEGQGKTDNEEKITALEEWSSNIESAQQEAENVEFPGMYS